MTNYRTTPIGNSDISVGDLIWSTGSPTDKPWEVILIDRGGDEPVAVLWISDHLPRVKTLQMLKAWYFCEPVEPVIDEPEPEFRVTAPITGPITRRVLVQGDLIWPGSTIGATFKPWEVLYPHPEGCVLRRVGQPQYTEWFRSDVLKDWYFVERKPSPPPIPNRWISIDRQGSVFESWSGAAVRKKSNDIVALVHVGQNDDGEPYAHIERVE